MNEVPACKVLKRINLIYLEQSVLVTFQVIIAYVNFWQKKAGKIMISQTSHEVALCTLVKEEILCHEGFLIFY